MSDNATGLFEFTNVLNLDCNYCECTTEIDLPGEPVVLQMACGHSPDEALITLEPRMEEIKPPDLPGTPTQRPAMSDDD